MTWTHIICTACWDKRQPGREPVRVRGAREEPCCFCGRVTAAGIYVCEDPRDLPCTHPDEDEPAPELATLRDAGFEVRPGRHPSTALIEALAAVVETFGQEG